MATISPPPPRKKRRVQGPSSPLTSSELQPILLPDPPSPPPTHWLRIYSWNINGIQPFVQPSIGAFIKPARPSAPRPDAPITTSLRNFLKRHQWPQLLHLQEVKINPSDESTKRSVENAVNRCRSGPDNGPHYVVRFCLPRDRYNANGFGRKIYGVATVIREDFLENEVQNIREVDWDIEGRVLVIETYSRLSLWNVYGVNGTANPYKDPTTGKVSGTRHDRKLAFHQAMLKECKSLEEDGWRLVMAGDFNVAREDIDGLPKLRTKPEQHITNRADFNSKFFSDPEGLQAIDSFRSLFPKRKRYTWLPRNLEWKSSADRVDYILCSKQLGDNEGTIAQADVLMTEQERGPSDHVPVYIALDLDNQSPPDESDQAFV